MAGDLTPVYYLVAIGGTVGSGLWAARSYLGKMKNEWTQQGAKEATLSDTLDANTKAAAANTQAITNLTREIRDLTVKTEERLSNHDRRIDRIESKGWGVGPDR